MKGRSYRMDTTIACMRYAAIAVALTGSLFMTLAMQGSNPFTHPAWLPPAEGMSPRFLTR
ncbi:hypothetical protein JW848_02900 [Candidatus Bipolaricaulota bacterium]|nr:hypothetical protein [Candidatus Bipolaricaulota bacterium]